MPRIALALVAFLSISTASRGQSFPSDWLTIPRSGRSGRSVVYTNALQKQRVLGRLSPVEGAKLHEGSKLTWSKAKYEKGAVATPRGGHAFCKVVVDEPTTSMLIASGHGAVYVNGAPRGGDPYSNGLAQVPVHLRAGENTFLFVMTSRSGRLRARLDKPEKPLHFQRADWTVPDLIAGETSDAWIGVPVVNATPRPMVDVEVVTSGRGFDRAVTKIAWLPPLTVHKRAIRASARAPQSGELELDVRVRHGDLADQRTLKVRVVAKHRRHRRTYRSRVDGSAQKYAVNPATGDERPALILSCHGASVPVGNQAGAYADKPWATLVAPSNRRPYGFDWEDWGRADALEVLHDVRQRYELDPSRTYLTGHSMGGHGTWHLGATFPGNWAAIGPSAGWISFFSYSSGRRYDNPDPMQALLQSATSTSDTLLLKNNYSQLGVYILHGDKDRNVPVREARRMKEVLSGFHRDFRYHEQPGVGHWWDDHDEPGAGCVDWQPMMDFFARRRLPGRNEVRSIDFTTCNPGVSARSHWAWIDAQQRQHAPSRIQIRWDPGKRRFLGTTANVARLRLEPPSAGALTLELDGSKISVEKPGRVLDLARSTDKAERWRLARRDSGHKGAHRYGPFKHVFDNRFVCVLGTKGTPEENAWALARARYDSDLFGYRGNGCVEIVPDTSFDAAKFAGRNVVLYGNATTNGAWERLLGKSPVQVTRDHVQIGKRRIEGDGLACLFIRPRPGDDRALVGVVAGTGMVGMRLADRAAYWVSGVHFPDVFCWRPEMLESGSKGIAAAGFFGLDWSVEGGRFVWQ